MDKINDVIIPKAKDAYNMARTNINRNLSYELYKIGDLIKEAIKKGEFEIKLCNETISDNVKNALINNGYTIKTEYPMDGIDTTISWKEAGLEASNDPCKKCDFEPKYSCTGCKEKIDYERKIKETKK